MSELSFRQAVPSGKIQLLDFTPVIVLQNTLHESSAEKSFLFRCSLFKSVELTVRCHLLNSIANDFVVEFLRSIADLICEFQNSQLGDSIALLGSACFILSVQSDAFLARSVVQTRSREDFQPNASFFQSSRFTIKTA